jgi:hypothetical protein
VLGTILWSRIPPEKEDHVAMMLTDYRKIKFVDPVTSELRFITPRDTTNIFEGLVWRQLVEGKEEGGGW